MLLNILVKLYLVYSIVTDTLVLGGIVFLVLGAI